MYEEALTLLTLFVPQEEYDAIADANLWTIQLTNAQKRSGCCHYTKRQISISAYIASFRGEQATMNTMIHEVMHIFSPTHGHKGEWKKYAHAFNTLDITKHYREAYGTINRTYNSAAVEKTYKYLIRCHGCDKVLAKRMKRGKMIIAIEAARKNKKTVPYSCGLCLSSDLRVEII